jgi:hypothetical protein
MPSIQIALPMNNDTVSAASFPVSGAFVVGGKFQCQVTCTVSYPSQPPQPPITQGPFALTSDTNFDVTMAGVPPTLPNTTALLTAQLLQGNTQIAKSAPVNIVIQ